MQIIQSNNPCILTGTHDAVVVCNQDRHGNPLRTIINKNSGLVYTDPRPDHEEVRKFYSDEYRKEYKGTETPSFKHIIRSGRLAVTRWRKIKQWVSEHARILDVGAGGGEMMYLLKKCGHEVHGIEPNVGYAEYARDQYRLNLEVGFIEDTKHPPENFDAIFLFHVFEHLENPVEEISRLGRLLKPGGVLVIEVPNVDHKQCFPAAKWHTGHLYNFNTVTLNATLEKSGFDTKSISEGEEGWIIFGIFQKHSPREKVLLDGNFDKIWTGLRSHTALKHLFSVHPYLRPLKKLARTIEENWATRKYESGREILDSFYEQQKGLGL